jgi:hypothetical protein
MDQNAEPNKKLTEELPETDNDWNYINDEWIYNPFDTAVDFVTEHSAEPSGSDVKGLNGPFHAITEDDPLSIDTGLTVNDNLKIDRSWVDNPEINDRDKTNDQSLVKEEPSLRSVVDHTDFVIPSEGFWVHNKQADDHYDPQSYGLPTQGQEVTRDFDVPDLGGLINTSNTSLDVDQEETSDVPDEAPLI